jgi:hypothetical protein
LGMSCFVMHWHLVPNWGQMQSTDLTMAWIKQADTSHSLNPCTYSSNTGIKLSTEKSTAPQNSFVS